MHSKASTGSHKHCLWALHQGAWHLWLPLSVPELPGHPLPRLFLLPSDSPAALYSPASPSGTPNFQTSSLPQDSSSRLCSPVRLTEASHTSSLIRCSLWVGAETLRGSSESFLVEPQGSRRVRAGRPVRFCWHGRDSGFSGVPSKYLEGELENLILGCIINSEVTKC